MKDRPVNRLQRPARVRTVLIIQVLVAVALLLVMFATRSTDGMAAGESDAVRVIVCSGPAPLEDFSIKLAGCQIMHCTETIDGSERYREVEFFIC